MWLILLAQLTAEQKEFCEKIAPPVRAKVLAAVKGTTAARWFPGEEGDAAPPKSLKKQADALAGLAEEARKRGMGATAGVEAFRALGLDPHCEKAGRVLGYVKSKAGWVHPQTLVTIRTDLPKDEAKLIGERLNWFVGWLRARFCLVEGYQEPKWPIEVQIFTKTADYDAVVEPLVGGPSPTPYGMSFYPTREFVVVNDEECRKSFEKTIGIAQHESSHAFFYLCFPGKSPTIESPFGWMVEAFPAYTYYVSPEWPLDGDFWKKLVQKHGNEADPRSKELQRVIDGENVIGQLNAITDYVKSKSEFQAYLAGAVLARYAYDRDDLRESYAKFCAKFFSSTARPEDFETLVGDPQILSRRMAPKK